MKEIVKNNLSYVCAFLITLFGFHLVYGISIIFPENINWLMSAYHDWGQHYLGWAYFREAPWTFPLGRIENFNYPAGTNVGYMDAIPLLALLLKPFSSLLSEDFQYLGMYLLGSHLLVTFFSIKILNTFKVNRYLAIISAILIALCPLMLYRGIHPATTAHWLILASLYYYLKPANESNALKINVSQLILVALASLINPYMVLFVIGFSMIIPFKHYYYDRLLSIKQVFLLIGSSPLIVLVLWFLLGMVSFGNEVEMVVTDSYGLYGANLNTFFNSSGFSRKIAALANYKVYQYEGFAYYGLGFLLFLGLTGILALGFSLFKKYRVRFRKKWTPLLIFILAITLFAITNQVTFGDQLLFEFPIPDVFSKLGNVFRASGRFVWLLYYVLILGAIVIYDKIPLGRTVKVLLILMIACLQFYDIQPMFHRYNFTYGSFSPDKLDDDKWLQLFSNHEKIITYPPFNNNLLYASDYQDLSFLALKENKPITAGYVARETVGFNQLYLDSLNSSLLSGNIGRSDLFLTTLKDLEKFSFLVQNDILDLGFLDGYYYLYSPSLQSKLTFDFSKEVTQRLDSIKRTIMIVPEVQSIEIPEHLDENIKMNVEHFAYVNEVLTMKGWAFIIGNNNSSNDELYISLLSDEEAYQYQVKTVLRQDVTDYFKAENLDNSGFELTISTNGLQKGAYQIAISIKESDGSFKHKLIDKPEITILE